jgi:hypothetical protein
MKKSVWTTALALVVVLSGIGVAGFAYWTSAQGASSGFPRSVSWLPGGADVVAHVDISALSQSPLRDAWLTDTDASRTTESTPRMQPIQELEDRLGIRVLDDIDFVSGAIFSNRAAREESAADSVDTPRPRPAPPERFCASVAGRFDHARILDHFRDAPGPSEGSVPPMLETEHEGVPIYERWFSEDPADDSRRSIAIAFPEDGVLLVGTSSCVREMLDAGHQRSASAVDDLVERWGDAAFFGQSFWISGSPDTLGASLPASDVSIPPISAFAVAGRLDHELVLQARGRAADVEAAQQLSDVVRGFVALGSLQKNSHPAFGQLAESVVIDQLETEVLVSASVPYETLQEAWTSRRRADHAEDENENERQ